MHLLFLGFICIINGNIFVSIQHRNQTKLTVILSVDPGARQNVCYELDNFRHCEEL